MNEVVQKAYAKINLALDVLGRRADGYHDVRMVMQTISLCDEIVICKEEQPGIRLRVDSGSIPTGDTNLAWRAASGVLQRFAPTAGISIALQKNIPVAAGLGGGSSDAAAVIRGINQLFELGLSMEEMCEVGVSIGADVPFCLLGGTALAEGIGEGLTPLMSPPAGRVLLVRPNISVSTRWVYQHLRVDGLKKHPDIDGMIEAIKDRDMVGITGRMGNVLETVTQPRYPVIRAIKQQMQQLGAEKALMSGSGPTVFAIFADDDKAGQAYDKMRQMRKEKDIFLTSFV
ncbi:MAG: 4-(cytidine 5'-diphospho)-2-C-methyl-D-erythritol kinase [Lachnospiraceae bacterium]|jgi:4-diphosphocytidyl-2-C-methyl-D-erythritol kinase|nr:4-(cytidine 5'-diphospho)-2-C-methyl-D-erythritol kinase [Lachnospiraceae bacterium]